MNGPACRQQDAEKHERKSLSGNKAQPGRASQTDNHWRDRPTLRINDADKASDTRVTWSLCVDRPRRKSGFVDGHRVDSILFAVHNDHATFCCWNPNRALE
jgi:hypothetical protein